MNKTKRLSREVALQLLYQWEQQGLISRSPDAIPTFIDGLDLPMAIAHFLHNFHKPDTSAIEIPLIVDLITGTIKSILLIDEVIDAHSLHWRTARMDAIDRAILRMATYELMIKREPSARVIINEAIELAKRYGGKQSSSFVNAILDAIKEGTDTNRKN